MYKLGFGMMRLPLTDPKEQTQVDREQARAMMDAYLEQGFTYVDTAYFYHGGESERVVRDILTSRYPREKYVLADKMPLANFKNKGTAEDQAKVFDEQLEKLKGCEGHCTVILSQVDDSTLKKLGINLTCEPKYQTKKLFHR